MILVDTSVWIEHFRRPDRALMTALDAKRVLLHPYVLGELTLGIGFAYASKLIDLPDLPAAPVVTTDEMLAVIERHQLSGCGIGYVDAHLVAAARLVHLGTVWTRDTRLAAVAARLGVGETLH